jgi:hypothetical protein
MLKYIVVAVLCEGQTEEAFIKQLIAPALRHLSIQVKPYLMPTSGTSKGGAVSIGRLKKNVRNLMCKPEISYVTTFLDLYGLDTDFPEYQASKCLNVYERVLQLEKALKDLLVKEFDLNQKLIFPYIQPYEFEGLLFSNVAQLVATDVGWGAHQSVLQKMRDAVDSPEHINDSFETKPSKRLEKILKTPKYKKVLHGNRIATNITLATIEQECLHFREWMGKLRALSI